MRNSISLVMLMLFATITGLSQAPDTRVDDRQQFSCEAVIGDCSIKGTSTLHDWESDIEDFSIQALRDGDLIDADFKVVVGSIKSGHSGMDKNTYRALNMDEYPEIRFSAKNLRIEDNNSIVGKGNLTIAGKTRLLPVRFNMTSWVENTMTITGEIEIKMTDFGVDPPVALFGTVKTGDDIIFVINTTLNKVNN